MKAYALRRAVYVLISGYMALYTVGVLAEEELEELFVYHQELSSMPPDTGPATIAEHEVTVDTWALARSERHAAEFLLPDGSRFRAVPEEIRYRGDWHTDFAWRGRLEGDGEEGRAVITVHQGHIAGSLTLPGRNNFTFKPGPEPGLVWLLEIDGSVVPECGVEDLPELELPGPVQPAFSVVPASAGSAPIIDVMVVYTPLARGNAGGHAQIQAQIQHVVDYANDAYANSEVFQRIELVHMQEVPYTWDQDGVTTSSQLLRLRNDPIAASLRNQHHADMVALFQAYDQGPSIAFPMRNPGPQFERSAFSVLVQGFLEESPSTFAHELGHNMGLEHDPDVGPDPENASYPWSFGHHIERTDGVWNRTIMAGQGTCPGWTDPVDPENPSCDRVPYFSNPNVTYLGGVTGTAGERDNVRTLNLTANIVADFRKGNYLYADRFEGRGYALSGITVPPPMTHAESCAELEKQLSLYEARLAEKISRLSESDNDNDARREYEEETAAVAGIREQLGEECQ